MSSRSPENAVSRRELGLRPTRYPDNGSHPDQGSCPSWCWIAQNEGYNHEVDPHHPLDAEHRLEANPSVVASLYPGTNLALGAAECRHIYTVTIEPRLEQRGQAQPVINLAMRTYENREQVYVDELLRLTVTDARELVAALEFLTADRS